MTDAPDTDLRDLTTKLAAAFARLDSDEHQSLQAEMRKLDERKLEIHAVLEADLANLAAAQYEMREYHQATKQAASDIAADTIKANVDVEGGLYAFGERRYTQDDLRNDLANEIDSEFTTCRAAGTKPGE
jgi:hypothetical protein